MSPPQQDSGMATGAEGKKLLEHSLVTGFGAATVCLFILLSPLVSNSHTEFYHFDGPAGAILWPTLINFVVLWLLLSGVIALAQRYRRFGVGVWSVLGAVLPWLAIHAWYVLRYERGVPHPLTLAYGAVVAATAVLLAVATARGSRIAESARLLLVTVLGFVGLSGALLIGQVLVDAWLARNLNTPRPLHVRAVPSAAVNRRRVIWLIFDELSYRQVFEHRYPGVNLPAFDRFAATATNFTNAVPAGSETEKVVPSFLTGIPVDLIKPPVAGYPLLLHNYETQKWVQLDPHNTVFQDALNQGYSTGVSGWYNPYCRLLPEVLDHCYWSADSAVVSMAGGMFSHQSFWWNVRQPLMRYLHPVMEWMGRRPASIDGSFVAAHQRDYLRLAADGDTMLNDPSLGFILLHMPIPHPGGMFNRKTRGFQVATSSYEDNLVLCDEYLQHVRTVLEQNGEWDDATLLVMGDHSWRVSTIWGPWRSEWTPEDEKASEGERFDPRPAYMVKLPEQHSGARIDAPYRTVRTRALLDGLLEHRFADPAQLRAWVGDGAQPASTAAQGGHSQ